MSRNSKAKRDQRKKKQARRPFLRLDREQPVSNHAVLQSADGRVLAAIGLQAGGEWMLGVGGQTMGSADNPVPMLAMLKHLANLQERDGQQVTLQYSEQLQLMIDDLAADEGKTAEDYLAALVAEFEDAGEDEPEEASPQAADSVDDTGNDAEPASPATEPGDANPTTRN
jgi:hypothetical protein